MFWSSAGLFYLDGTFNSLTVYEDKNEKISIFSAGTVSNMIRFAIVHKEHKIIEFPLKDVEEIEGVKVQSLNLWVKKMFKDYSIKFN